MRVRYKYEYEYEHARRRRDLLSICVILRTLILRLETPRRLDGSMEQADGGGLAEASTNPKSRHTSRYEYGIVAILIYSDDANCELGPSHQFAPYRICDSAMVTSRTVKCTFPPDNSQGSYIIPYPFRHPAGITPRGASDQVTRGGGGGGQISPLRPGGVMCLILFYCLF